MIQHLSDPFNRNTKVKFFTKYAEGVEPFRAIAKETPEPNAMSHLLSLDQEKTCHIAQAADLCLMLTKGLNEEKGVFKQQGRVTDASYSNVSISSRLISSHLISLSNDLIIDHTFQSTWTISVSSSNSASSPVQIDASRLILCTGSSPIDGPLPTTVSHLNAIHLDTALSPAKLTTAIPTDTPTQVAVIGASHSAILVLRNLSNLAASTHPQLRIKWFTRHPLRYAEERDGWIKRDNTGLKGEVAVWARANLEPAVLADSPVGLHLTAITTSHADETDTYTRELADCQYICQAIGYKVDALPELRVEGKAVTPVFDNATGGFTAKEDGERLPGVYGAGIAFPERVTDPEGSVEYAVGLFKFMNFLKKVTPGWKAG